MTHAQPLITEASEWIEGSVLDLFPQVRVSRLSGSTWAVQDPGLRRHALWPSGRIEAWAVAPGVPTLADQEKDDQVAAGDSYLRSW